MESGKVTHNVWEYKDGLIGDFSILNWFRGFITLIIKELYPHSIYLVPKLMGLIPSWVNLIPLKTQLNIVIFPKMPLVSHVRSKSKTSHHNFNVSGLEWQGKTQRMKHKKKGKEKRGGQRRNQKCWEESFFTNWWSFWITMQEEVGCKGGWSLNFTNSGGW